MTVQEADAMLAMARGDVGGASTIRCELYHPTVEFASCAEWVDHNKAVHLGATFVVSDAAGGGRAHWRGSADDARPCIPSPVIIRNAQLPADFGRRQLEYSIVKITPEMIEASRERPDDIVKLKHGPNESGRAGPCEPGCRKCALKKPTVSAVSLGHGFQIRCASCGVRPPRAKPIISAIPNAGNHDAIDLTGWALFAFPLDDTLRNGLLAREAQRFCRPCAEKLAKFITHVSTPMLHEEDLL